MSVRFRVAGILKSVSTMRIRVNGGLKSISRVRLVTGSGTKIVESFGTALSVTVSPDEVSGSSRNKPAATTGYATVTISGGREPYSILWTKIAGTGGGVGIEGPALASARFTQPNPGEARTDTATFQATVTDARGATATGTATATFYHIGEIIIG